MKNPNADIDRAIASAIGDVQPERVTNWCAHVQTRQVGVSFLGQQVGLPIGPKEIACTKTGGSIQAQTYRAAAETFVSMNCASCTFRAPVSDDNICAELLDEARSATERQAASEAEQRSAADAARALAEPSSDLQALLKQDPATDEQVRGLIAGLADPERQREAGRILAQASAKWPELFSERAAAVLIGLVRDPGCGDLVLATVRNLGKRTTAIAAKARRLALDLLTERWMGPLADEAAKTVAEASQAGELVEMTGGAIGGLIRLRGALVRPPWLDMVGKGNRGPRPVDQALEVLVLNASAEVLEQTNVLLLSPDPHDRAAAANAAVCMAEHPQCFAELDVSSLVEHLIAGLALSDDDEDADPSLKVAISHCRKTWPSITTRTILGALPNLPLPAAKLAVQSLQINTQRGDPLPPVGDLIPVLTNEQLPLELRAELADALSDIGHDDPAPLWTAFDELLAALVLVVDERARIATARPPDDATVSKEQFYDIELDRLHSRTLTMRTQSAIASAALWGGAAGISALASVLKGATTEIAGPLKVAILEILGEIGEKVPDYAPELVPIIYPHILNPDSHSVRGAAVRALAELTRYSRNVLPDDVVLLVAQLFNDQYLHPVISGAVSLFERAHVNDRALAAQLMRALRLLYEAYAQDPGESYLHRSISEALLNLTRQHSDFRPYAVRSLSRMAQNEYYYTARDALRDFGYLARWYADVREPFVDSLIDFYDRFSLEIALDGQYLGPGQSDDAFRTLFDLPAGVVTTKGGKLMELARGGKSHRNPEFVAALLLSCSAPETEAAFRLAETKFPDEDQYEWRRERANGLAALVAAERAVAAADLELADDEFRTARKHFEHSAAPASRMPFGLPDLPADPDHFTPWAEFRREWVGLPDRPQQADDTLTRLKDRLGRLAQPSTERDEGIHTIVSALLDGLRRFADYHRALRAADSSASHLFNAGIALFQDAAEDAAAMAADGRIPQEVAFRIDALLGVAREFKEAGSFAGLARAFRQVQLPVPLGDLPAPRSWRTTSRGQRWRDRQPSEVAAPAPPPLARVGVVVNGAVVNDVLNIVARQIYDVEIQIDLDSALSAGDELVVKRVSGLPSTAYHFPEARIPLSADVTHYVIPGTMHFEYVHADGSAPSEVKILVRVSSDGIERDVEPFGSPALRVSVREHRPLDASEPDENGFSHTEQTAPAIVLTADELQEHRRHGFRSMLMLDVSYRYEKRRNVVKIGQNELRLVDADYKALMLLVAGAVLRDGGWVPRASLRSGSGLALEGQFFPNGIDQALKRLRDAFAPALQQAPATDLIETSGDGRVRLSVHRRYLRWHRPSLLKHRLSEVRAVGEVLGE